MSRSLIVATAVSPLLALALAVGCQQDKPTTNPDEAPAGAADAPADGSEATAAWASMDPDQKKEHMMTVVMPQTTKVFQGFNAEHYAEVNCATCHGPGAMKGEFTMPSPSLPKLSPNGDFSAEMEHKAEVTQFMMGEVVPQMASALGVEPYDAKTGQGFGCYGCHQTK